MRRKISDKALNDAADGLPDLTEQQRKFVEGVLTGKTLIDAYRAAYDCSGMAPNSTWVAASRLRSHANIALWISAATKAHFGIASRTREQHIAKLAELGAIAVETGNVGAAVQAEQLIGKVEGHYTERLDISVTDPLQTLREIAQFAPELAAKLAADQGIEWQETQH
jgi:hypothetical protein